MSSNENATASAQTMRSVSNTNSSSQQASPGHSRRTSGIMGPPPIPNSSLPNSPRPPHATMQRSPSSQGQEQGPLRHPRPLTAAELHLELEKEQESIVNRLTRELSALRAQTASVASTTSSTSDLFTANTEHHFANPTFPTTSGASIIPTSARRHRSSSNLSTRSARSIRDAVARDAAASSVSGVAAPRDSERSHQTSARQSLDIQRPDTSRQNSYNLGLSTSTSTGNMSMYRSTSNATSPYAPPAGYGHAHRSSLSTSHARDPSMNDSRSPSFSSAQAAARYEEVALHKQEMEIMKKENEALKQKIRDLEKQLAGG